MTQTKRKKRLFLLVLYALLTAVMIVLAVVNIPMPSGLSITFNMIPVAVAAIAAGLEGGLVMGAVFGLISFLQCFGILGFSAMGAALVSVAPFATFVQRFVSRVVMGLLTALIYRSIRSRVPRPVGYGIAGFSAAFLNTLFFMSLLVLLLGGTDYMTEAMAGRGFLVYITASVGVNGLVEMAVSALLTAAIGTALQKARLIHGDA